MKKRWRLLPLCLLLALLPATALAAEGPVDTQHLNFLLYASVTSAQTAHSLADALLQRAASWEDLASRPDPGQACPDQAAALLEGLNALRETRGLSPLSCSAALTSQAMERAEAYTRSLSRPGGLRRFCGGNDTPCAGEPGETRALGQTPAAVLRAWLRRPETRETLLTDTDPPAGSGCFLQNGRYCWVLLLGSGTRFRVLLPPGDPCRGLAGGPVPSRGE